MSTKLTQANEHQPMVERYRRPSEASDRMSSGLALVRCEHEAPERDEDAIARSVMQSVCDVLPSIDDDELRSFMIAFATIAYGQNANQRLAQILDHPWLRRLLTAQLRSQFGLGSPYDYLDAMVHEAKQELALQFLRRSWFGVPPERIRELAGYMLNFARDAVRRLRRQIVGGGGCRASDQTLSIASSLCSSEPGPVERCLLAECKEAFLVYFRERLNEDDRTLLYARYVLQFTWDDVATSLGMTESQSRARAERLLDQFQERFDLPADRSIVALFVEFLFRSEFGDE